MQEKRVQEELQRTDPDLFLDKLYDREGQYVYYAIRYKTPEGTEPLTCIHWRTIYGPLPLSLDIVNAVRVNEGDIREAIKTATVNNALKKDKALQERAEAFQEELDWYQKSSKKLGVYPMSGKPKNDSV